MSKQVSLGNVVTPTEGQLVTQPKAHTIELKKNDVAYRWFGLFVVLIMLGGSVTWAAVFELDKAVVTTGKVIVASKNKQVQHLDGGIVKEILVKDGDVVNEGETLFRFDDTQLVAQLESVQGQLWEMESILVRLKAERDQKAELVWEDSGLVSEEVPDDVRETQESLFSVRRDSLKSRKEALIQRRMQSESQIAALEQQILGAGERIKGQHQQIKSQQQRIKSQQQRARAQQERIKGQSQRIRGQDQQAQGQQQQIQAQKQRAAGVRGRITGYQQRIQKAKEQIGSLHRQRQILGKEIARLRDLFARKLISDLELRDKERENEQLVGAIANQQAGIADMQAQIVQAQEEIKQTNTEIKRLQTEIGRVGSQKGNIYSETEGMKAEVASMLAEAEGMKDEMGGMHTEIARLKTEIGRMKSEIVRIRQGIVEIGHQIDLEDDNFLNQVSTQMGEIQQQLPQLMAQQKSIEDRLSRIEVVAPTSGKVKGFEVVTVGAVIQSGRVIMEIVPMDQDFSITAEVSPTDIDVIDIGAEDQTVEIRFSVFDEARLFPVLHARLRDISTDTLINEQTGMPYYKASLALADDSLELLAEKQLQLVSGMPVEVLIVTGKRTMLDYLIKPLADIFVHAFNEA